MNHPILINAILIVGLCLGTVGAAGFSEPPESLAWPLFLSGLGLMTLGGVLHRRAARAKVGAAGDGGASATLEFKNQLRVITERVIALDDSKQQLGGEGVRSGIDALLRDEYFDFTSRHEEWVNLLGFNRYASVWNGVAVAERLLSRAWSMVTDGHVEEGLEEIPLARQHLERSLAASASL